mgnify:CR=1 FL=1
MRSTVLFIVASLLELSEVCSDFLLRSDQDFLEVLLAGTCRDSVSADDILLKTLEIVYAAADSSLGENLGSLLE